MNVTGEHFSTMALYKTSVFTFRPSQRGGAMLTLHADLLPHHRVFPLNKDQHYDKRCAGSLCPHMLINMWR